MITITIPGPCMPAPRPRLTRSGHVYYKGDYKAYQSHVRHHAGLAQWPDDWDPLARYAVSMWLEDERPPRRCDVDNQAKGVMDSLNRLAWTDDNRVDQLHVYRSWNQERTVTTVQIWGLDE